MIEVNDNIPTEKYNKKIPKSEQKILEEVEYLQDEFFTFDEPVPFCGLSLYPVNTRNYNKFLTFSSCLTLNKNDDPMGITKNHLDYLIFKMKDENEGPIWSFKFSKLMEMIFHIKNGLKCNKCGKFLSYDELIVKAQNLQTEEDKKNLFNCDVDGCDGVFNEIIKYSKDENTKKTILIIDNHKITNEDFNRLRKIVMYQNLPDFKDDSWVDKSIRDDQALKSQMLAKKSGTASLERKVLCLCAKTNYKIEDVYAMSMRKFTMLLGIVQDAMDYQITKTGLMSGMVSLKKGQEIDHWIYKKDTGMYGASVDTDELIKKINS